jgi:hypothetical protein
MCKLRITEIAALSSIPSKARLFRIGVAYSKQWISRRLEITVKAPQAFFDVGSHRGFLEQSVHFAFGPLQTLPRFLSFAFTTGIRAVFPGS